MSVEWASFIIGALSAALFGIAYVEVRLDKRSTALKGWATDNFAKHKEISNINQTTTRIETKMD